MFPGMQALLLLVPQSGEPFPCAAPSPCRPLPSGPLACSPLPRAPAPCASARGTQHLYERLRKGVPERLLQQV